MRRLALYSLLPLAALGGCHRQEPPAPQATAQSAATTAAAQPMAVVTANKGKPMPTASFTDLADGKPVALAAFKGKPVLVNLWATWCVPCVRELPTLAQLAQQEGDKLAVVTISEDMEGTTVVEPFLKDHGLTVLHPYHDRDNALPLALKEAGLPVTILYDANGRELWRVPGDLDWTGARARALLAEAGV